MKKFKSLTSILILISTLLFTSFAALAEEVPICEVNLTKRRFSSEDTIPNPVMIMTDEWKVKNPQDYVNKLGTDKWKGDEFARECNGESLMESVLGPSQSGKVIEEENSGMPVHMIMWRPPVLLKYREVVTDEDLNDNVVGASEWEPTNSLCPQKPEWHDGSDPECPDGAIACWVPEEFEEFTKECVKIYAERWRSNEFSFNSAKLNTLNSEGGSIILNFLGMPFFNVIPGTSERGGTKYIASVDKSEGFDGSEDWIEGWIKAFNGGEYTDPSKSIDENSEEAVPAGGYTDGSSGGGPSFQDSDSGETPAPEGKYGFYKEVDANGDTSYPFYLSEGVTSDDDLGELAGIFDGTDSDDGSSSSDGWDPTGGDSGYVPINDFFWPVGEPDEWIDMVGEVSKFGAFSGQVNDAMWVPIGRYWSDFTRAKYCVGPNCYPEEKQILNSNPNWTYYYNASNRDTRNSWRKRVVFQGNTDVSGGGVVIFNNVDASFGDGASITVHDDTILVFTESTLVNPRIIIKNRERNGNYHYKILTHISAQRSQIHLLHSVIEGDFKVELEGNYFLKGWEDEFDLIATECDEKKCKYPTPNPWKLEPTSIKNLIVEVDDALPVMTCLIKDKSSCLIDTEKYGTGTAFMKVFYLGNIGTSSGRAFEVSDEAEEWHKEQVFIQFSCETSECKTIVPYNKGGVIDVEAFAEGMYGQFVYHDKVSKKMGKIAVVNPTLHNEHKPWETTAYNEEQEVFEVVCTHENLVAYEDPTDTFWYEEGLNNECRCNGEVEGLYAFDADFAGYCRPTEKKYEEMKAAANDSGGDTVVVGIKDDGGYTDIHFEKCELGKIADDDRDSCVPCPNGMYEPKSPVAKGDRGGDADYGAGSCEVLDCDPDEYFSGNECRSCAADFIGRVGVDVNWFVPDPDYMFGGCVECPGDKKAAYIQDGVNPGETISIDVKIGDQIYAIDVQTCVDFDCPFANAVKVNHTCVKCPQGFVADIETQFCIPEGRVNDDQEPKSAEITQHIDYFHYLPPYAQHFIGVRLIIHDVIPGESA